jgi:hypothetical protein
MSSCLINRDAQGRITKVTTPEGQPSELFNEIHSNILLDNVDISAEIVSSIYSKEVADMFKGAQKNVYGTKEPKIFYKSALGDVYDTFFDVLKNNELGEVTLGFKNPNTDEFISAFSVDTNSSAKTKFLTSVAQQGIISSKRVIGEDGVARFSAQGEYAPTRRAHARASQLEAIFDLGQGNTTFSEDGLVEFNFDDEYVTAVTSDGESKTIRIEDIPMYENVDASLIALHGTVTNERPAKSGDKVPVRNEKALKQALLNFLRNMGFTYSTLEEYRKNYNTRYGQDADITAIADLANKVVAISEGANITEELLEEVAHIAIEAYADQASIAGLLVNVEFTSEYAEFNKQYRDKYSKYFEGVELEDHVRKEILGKILAKSIQNNFNEENKTPEQVDLLTRLKNLWDQFVNFISGKATPYQKDILADLNNKIADYVLSNNINQFDTNLKSDKFFYDLSDETSKKMAAFLKDSKETLERIFSQIVGQPLPDKAQLEKIGTDMLQLDVLDSVNSMQGTTKTQLDRIEEAYNLAAKKGESVSQQDHDLFTHINQQVIPLLDRIKSELSVTKEFDEELVPKKKQLIQAINEVVSLNSKLRIPYEKDLKAHADKMMARDLEGKTPEQIEDIKQAYETVHKDQNFLGSLFGLASKSQNVWIRKAGMLAARLQSKVDQTVKPVIDKFLRDNAGKEQFQKDIVRKVDGKLSAYYWGMVREDLFEKDKEKIKIATAAKLTGVTEEVVSKKLSEGLSFKSILGTEALLKEFKKTSREEIKALRELARQEDYYKEQEAKQVRANISVETKDILSDVSSQRAIIYGRAGVRDPKTGVIDRTKLTPGDKQAEAQLKQLYEAKKSPYEANTETKAGLRVIANKELTGDQKKALFLQFGPIENEDILNELVASFKGFVVESIDNMEDLPRDSRVALDMFNLAILNRRLALEKGGNTRTSNKFQAEVTRFEEANDFENLFEWATSNGSFALNDAYYKLSEDNVNFSAQAEKFIENLEDENIKDALTNDLKQLKRLQLVKSNFLKQFRDKNNPMEVHVFNSVTQDKIREIEKEIAEIEKDFRESGFEYEYKASKGPKAMKSTNESYQKDLRASGNEEVDFALKHMAEHKQVKFNEFSNSIDKHLSFRRKTLSQAQNDFIQRMLDEGKLESNKYSKFLIHYSTLEKKGINATKTEKDQYERISKEIAKDLKKLYARENVASYYLKYEIEGYKKLTEDLRSGAVKFSDILNDKESLYSTHPSLEYLDFNPDYTWTEDLADNDTVNTNFDTEGTFEQPKLEKYVDREWFAFFGIDVEAWLKNPIHDISQMTANKNKEAFALLQDVIAVKKTVLAKQGDSQKISPYLRPQVTKNMTEGVFTGGLKSIATNLVRYRVEELEYGDQLESGNVKDLGVRRIPKYYQKKVEDESTLTENILSAALLDLQQAVLYEQRVKAQRDFQALELQIKNQGFVKTGGAGKVKIITNEGENSAYYKQLKEITDYQLYGVRQTRNMTVEFAGKEFDMTKIIHHVQSFFRMGNLALNPFVDAVSMTTGVYNNAMDRYVKDYYASSSANRANTETTRLAGEFITETGKVSKDGLMNHLVEFFSMQEMQSRLQNSAFARGTKIAAEAGYKMSKFANMPVSGKVLITTLMDYRFVDGQFRNYEQFYSYKKNQNKGISKTAIRAEFDNYKQDSLYDNLSITKEGITFSDKYTAKYPNLSKEDIVEQFSELVAKMSYRTRSIAQGADGTLNELDQVAAQRDVMWSVAMTHRGWLPILLSKKFGKKHYSEAFDRYEEGQLTSLMELVKSIPRGLKEGKAYTEIFSNLEMHQQKNVKRIMMEMLSFAAMLAAGAMFFGDDDDDDTTYAYDIANYVFTRTVSEVGTQTPLGLTGAMVETLKNPFTSIRLIEALEPIELATDVVSGNYEDLGKRLLKNTPIKRFDQIVNVKDKLDSYKHFNKSTLITMSPEWRNDFMDSPVGGLF